MIDRCRILDQAMNGSEKELVHFSRYDFVESDDTLNYMKTWHENPNLLKLRKASFYSELDYYATISIYDIYGNIKDTKLIKINK